MHYLQFEGQMYYLTTNETEVDFYFTNIRLSLFLKGPPNGLSLQQHQNMQTFIKKSSNRLHVYLWKWLKAYIYIMDPAQLLLM